MISSKNKSKAQSLAPGNSVGPWCVALVAMLLVLCGVVSADAQQVTGTVTGTVTDSVGAVVPGAQVKATNAATGYIRSTATDNAGAYTIQYLPIGKYTVEITAPGFKK